MKPFTIIAIYADACTPDNNIQGCTMAETEEGDLKITVNSSEGLFNLIQNVCQKISTEIQGYKDDGTTPKDDASSDIENSMDLLNSLSFHIWD